MGGSRRTLAIHASDGPGNGIEGGRLVDERRDPYHVDSSGSVIPFRVESAIRLMVPGPGCLQRRSGTPGEDSATGTDQTDDGHDGLFLEVLQQLPRETRDFVPRFLAAARIGMDPVAYGFRRSGAGRPLDLRRVVTVPDATSLDVIARASQVDQSTLEELNPQLLRGLTPPEFPPGSGCRKGWPPNSPGGFARDSTGGEGDLSGTFRRSGGDTHAYRPDVWGFSG